MNGIIGSGHDLAYNLGIKPQTESEIRMLMLSV